MILGKLQVLNHTNYQFSKEAQKNIFIYRKETTVVWRYLTLKGRYLVLFLPKLRNDMRNKILYLKPHQSYSHHLQFEFYHQVLFADPAVSWKLLQHGHKVLDAAVPVTQQENHHEEGQDAEEQADHLQVCIGHLLEDIQHFL